MNWIMIVPRLSKPPSKTPSRVSHALLPCEGLLPTGLELRANLAYCMLSLLEKARGSLCVLVSSLIWLSGSSLTLAYRLAGRIAVHLVPRELE